MTAFATPADDFGHSRNLRSKTSAGSFDCEAWYGRSRSDTEGVPDSIKQ